MNIQQFNYSVDLLQAILWQYDEATHLLSLVDQKNEWWDINQNQFWENWYTNVFNLLTADAFGIAVWSIILNVPLYILNEVEPSDKPIFGFNSFILSGTLSSGMNTVTGLSSTSKITIGMTVWDNNNKIPFGTTVASIVNGTEITLSNNATGSITENITFFIGNSYLNFGNSNFSTRGQVITLTLEEQRFLLRLRYFQLYTAGAVSNPMPPAGTSPPLTGVNNFLNYLITTSHIGYSGTIYMLDGLDMTITYVFTASNFPPNLLKVIQILDIFPRSVGVGIKTHINYGFQFGFNAIVGSWPNLENSNKNFSNGNFLEPFI